MNKQNWTPNEQQTSTINRYKQEVLNPTNADGTPSPHAGEPVNVASRMASLYKEGRVEEAKALYRQSGIDESLTDDMQETARGTTVTNSGRVLAEKGDRLFNDRGELNAMDSKDALLRIERYAEQTLWNQKKELVKTRLSNDQKEVLMSQVQEGLRLGNTQPLGRIIAQLQRPIRRVLDYIGFARPSCVTHEVAQGELPYYDVDPRVSAYTTSNDGVVPASRVESERVFPRRTRIMSYVQVSVEEAAIRSFNTMERSKDLAIQDIQRNEDRSLLNAWWLGANDTNTPLVAPPSLTLSFLEDLGATVDANDLHATRIYMNRQELKDIRANMISSFDPVTQRELLNTGIMGTLLGYMIYVSPVVVPPGYVFATTDPDYLSYMAIWINTTAEYAPRFVMGEPVFGFLIYEVVGFTVVNDAAVAVGVKGGSAFPSYFTLV